MAGKKRIFMVTCEKLTGKNIKELGKLNTCRLDFNSLNQDFMSLYNKSNPIKKIILRREIKLIASSKEFIGYAWLKKTRMKRYVLNSLYVPNNISAITAADSIFDDFSESTIITYECCKNDFNHKFLEKLGFLRDEGILELVRKPS